jgi:hypothetical protein
MNFGFKTTAKMENQNENQTPVTPMQHGRVQINSIDQQPNYANFCDLNDNELQVLVTLAINTLRNLGIEFNTSVPQTLKKPDIFDNAKYEQIACNGLQPKYDGSPDELIPTLNAMHIRRQNEAWYVATF